MKNLILLPLLLLTLSSVAQIDTAYLPPFAYITYDTHEWEMKETENDLYANIRLKGKIEKGFELKIRLNLGDTLITKENLLAKFEKRTPYGREMVVESFSEMGEYYLGVFSFSQDECSRNDIPQMFKSMKFRAAFRIINNTNLLSVEIDDDSFFFPEETQTKKIQDAVNAIHVVTPSQMDKLLELPWTKEKAASITQQVYDKSYRASFDFNLSKRKCFDDSYFMEELSSFMPYTAIDSLLNFGSDSTLSDLVASHQAALDSSYKSDEIKSKVQMGFNYTERTELLDKARKQTFSLFEYLDFQLGEAQEGSIQRLTSYINQDGEYDRQDKYRKIINQLFAQKYLSDHNIHDIKFKPLGDHKFLAQIYSTLNDTIFETLFFHLKKTGTSYLVNKLNLPKEFSISWDKNQTYFSEEILELYIETITPFWEANITISSSPNNQFLSIYSNKNDVFPKYISLGTSKDVNWIPISPVVIDSSRFVMLENKNGLDVGTGLELLWNQFTISTEKTRLDAEFLTQYNTAIDSAIYANHSGYGWGMSDIQIAHWEIESFVQSNSNRNYIAAQSEGIGDLNKDGKEDIYSILICNGKVIDAKAYLLYEKTYKVIGTKEVVKLLKDNTGFKNLLLSSQIGNHGTKSIATGEDLYKITQE